MRPVATEAPDGGGRIWLDNVGIVQGVRFSTSQNGDLAASWQMILPDRRDHSAFTPGRRVLIPAGADYWRGTLNNPRGGAVWEFTADGWAHLPQNYTAVAPTSGNAWNLDEVTDAMISRAGAYLPWTRPAALPTTQGQQGSGAATVAQVLSDVTDAENRLWHVSRGGQVTAGARPTAVAYLLLADDTAGGRSVGGFVTDVHVTYQDTADYAIKTLTRSITTPRRYGRFEQPLDVTDRGAITTAKAQALGDNYLARRGPRLAFTNAFTVSPGQLLSPGGTAVDLSVVQATDGVVKILLTDPDSAGGELTYQATSLIMGETEFDEDAGLLTITPLEVNPTGLAAVFS